MELPERGVVLYTFGNASAVDRDSGVFAIKPSGIAYADLKPEDLVIVDLDGEVVDGRLRPSSDTATHALLYREFAGIGGVSHTHSPHATAWAQAGRPIPILGTTHADLAPGEIPCTRVMTEEETAGDYEVATGRLIVERFDDLDAAQTPMVLVARHGPFTWGATAEKAVEHSVMLEELARIAWLTVALDPRVLPLERWLSGKHFERKHGDGAYYGQT
jgi:L-ribulose-5-phosphate 4-epimerase